jgi:phosphopantetheine--protein transferase-like protein
MIIRTGVDVIDLKNAQNILDDPGVVSRMLSPHDIAGQSREHIAGRIALKEAVMKATDLVGIKDAWKHIHIRRSTSGRPMITIDTPVKGLASIDGSISHHGDFVVAMVTALYEDLEEVK